MRIAVLGAGSWGTALAAMAADAGHATTLWGRDAAAVRALAASRTNPRYLPGITLAADLAFTAALGVAVAGAELVVLALPTASVRAVATEVSALAPSGVTVVCASKGLEDPSRQTLDQVLEQAVPGAPIVLFSGPTFASEVAARLPAAAVVASRHPAAAARVQRAFASDHFRVYTTDDVVGVAVGGALKNVIAIAVGCTDGLGFGSNARAALITRGLNEMGRLALRLGGHPLTLAGLAGLGDLVLTCTGELSRNRRVGLGLAAGEPLAAITARLGHVAEGVPTARIAADLGRELGVDLPIITAIAAVLAGRCTPREAVAELLAREPRPERG
jgi:glycerol-3-phosphate dehydrogenase (NAD(P)+)